MIARSSPRATPEAGPLGLAHLAGRRRRHVHLGRVGVAAPQLRVGRPAAGLARRAQRPRLVGDLHDRAGPGHVAGAHPPHRHLDAVQPARLVAPVLAQLGLGVVAAAIARPGVAEADAVEPVEVRGLPVVRLVGLDAHHLVAVARPVDRPVLLRPREAHRIVGAEVLGERLVVEPRLAAVGHRRQRQRARQRHAEQRRDAEPRPQRQPLQPQEADGQRGDRGAEHQRPRAAQRDDRRDDHHEQRRQRQERVAARVRPRPARDQRRHRQHQRPGELQRHLRPRVAAVVRQPHGPERLRAARHAVDQVVPVARAQEVEREGPRRRPRRAAPTAVADERARPAHARRQPVAREHRGARAGRRRDPQQRAAGAQPVDHPLPLQRAERRQRGEAEQPRRPHGQQRVGPAIGCAHCADSISFWRSSIRRIFPVSVFGSSSTNSIRRGYA